MSFSITEKASELRAIAASSIIRNELLLREINLLMESFKVVSNTSEEISDKERPELFRIKDKIKGHQEQLILAFIDICSAVSAWIRPSNSAATITSIIDDIDNAKKNITKTENILEEFEDADFPNRVNIIRSVEKELKGSLTSIIKASNELHLLLFEIAS